VLRALTEVPFMVEQCEKLCRGNRYTTTLHAISSAINKLSRLTAVTNVYRGIGGGVLPRAFWEPDDDGACGAVEFGFMSTTRERSVAVGYAGASAATVVEIQMGMMDRGAVRAHLAICPHHALHLSTRRWATRHHPRRSCRSQDLSWLSQYPHENEVCFAPLCALELISSRVDRNTIVVEVRPTVNQKARSIEQVVARMRSRRRARLKRATTPAPTLPACLRSLRPTAPRALTCLWSRRRSHLQLIELLLDDLHQARPPPGTLSALEGLRRSKEKQASAWFNVPANYQVATDEVHPAASSPAPLWIT